MAGTDATNQACWFSACHSCWCNDADGPGNESYMDGGTVSQANVDAVVEGAGTVAQAVVVANMEAERCGCSILPKQRVIWHDAWTALDG